jgi:hypothetical protein
MNDKNFERICKMPFSSVYPHYIAKVEKKGKTKAELDEVIRWLTGYDQQTLQKHLDQNTDFKTFFTEAKIHPNASKITGVICGYRVEDIKEPLNRQFRYLDKLIDELANGKAMEKILRQ